MEDNHSHEVGGLQVIPAPAPAPDPACAPVLDHDLTLTPAPPVFHPKFSSLAGFHCWCKGRCNKPISAAAQSKLCIVSGLALFHAVFV